MNIPDIVIHNWLSKGGLINLIVTIFSVAVDVEHNVLLEFDVVVHSELD